MALEPDFRLDGPHDPELTKAAAAQVSERVKFMAYATRSGSGGLDLDAAYSLLGSLAEAFGRLPQAVSQLSGFLNAEFDAGRVADYKSADALPAVCKASAALGDAESAATRLTQALQSAQNAISGLSVKEDGDD